MTCDDKETYGGEPGKILAGVDSRSEPFRTSLLEWRPEGRGDAVPMDVYEARLSLLGEGDRAVVEKEFSDGKSGKEFKRLFFGGDVFGSRYRNDAANMMHCAFACGGAEEALRIFCASASFDAVRYDDGAVAGFDENGECVLRDEKARFRPLAKRAAEVANDYREKFDALGRDVDARAKGKGSRALASEKSR